MRNFHQIPIESNRIYYGIGWVKHLSVRSDKFVYSLCENLEGGDELQYTDVV